MPPHAPAEPTRRAAAVHAPRKPARDLREYLDLLRREGELVECGVEIDADLEAAEVQRRVIAAGGPALFFPRVKGRDFPLATNLFGTAKRIELAFGSRPQELIAQAARLPRELVPPTLGKLWSKRAFFLELAKVGMRRRASGPVRACLQDPPKLTKLPALKTWKRDGGPFVTLPLVYTESPDGHGSNLGMYRIQVFDDATYGVHMQIGRGGGFHLAAAEKRGRALPVNVFVGGPPALMLGAIAPLPENVPELLLASLALGGKLELCDNDHGPLPLVSAAEFALVGRIEPGARRPEGPFGDHYGYYSEVHDYPFAKVDALYHREGAIWPATVVGKPRQEDFFLGDYLQELLSPLFPVVMPSVRALWSYGETGYHSLSAAVVEERYKREAMASAFRILGEGQLSLTKFLLLTNQPVDLRDFRATLTHVLERADFRTDLFLFGNLSMDSLDYAGPRINEGGKGVLLGVGPKQRELPREFTGSHSTLAKKVRVFSPGCVVVEGPSYATDKDAPSKLARDPAFASWPLVVLSDDADRHVKSTMNFLWATFTRFNPAADLHPSRVELVGTNASYHPPIVLDARMKPWYPEELFCDDDTSKLVDRRWNEYFPGRNLEMGDSGRGHLS
ncbi:MAG: UbiD family decarboxylase [Planctomycetes bacterium]|nr:UbiD family decarboxylase [Planctomycetota bacterium]